MFDSLSEKLGGILDRLTRRGALTEADVDAAMREVRRALLEADVSLDVARAFTDSVKKHAVGVEVMKSVTPGQMVVKIVHDELIATLGSDGQTIDLNAVPPVAIMMVGLQGSGKTTTTAKLAKRLAERQKRKVLMASLDVRRPAAMEQLAVLGRDAEIDTLPVVAGQKPAQIAKRALEAARLGGYDVVLLDTAGRTTLDDAMMSEAAEVKRAANPHEVLLVADALTGQDAVNLARSFDERVGLTGIVLTRVDGDGRGGAALSMRAVTGKPIKLIGTGEKLDALEDFDPSRIAGRILGMGDVVSLVEKAAATIDAEKAARVAEKMRKGAFDLADMREQLTQMQSMGGMSGLMGMLPGVAKMKNQIANAGLDDSVLKRQIAIIDSMTPRERRNPDILKASRKKRIAAGSGTTPEAINKLLKMHRGMADMMKAMGSGKRGPLAGLGQMMGFGAGGQPTPEQMAELAKKCRAASCRRACPVCRRPCRNCRRISPALPVCRASVESFLDCRACPVSEKRSDQSLRKEPEMSLVIRMARAGTKKRPVYHIVVADSRSPRDGRFIERLGYFNPLLPKEKTERLKLDLEKVQAWMKKGAQPSDRVTRFLDAAGIVKREKAQQSGKGGPAQGTQGQGRGSHQGQGSRRRGGQDRRDRQGCRGQGRPAGGELALARRGRPHPRRPHRCRARHSRRGEAVAVHARPDGGGRLRSAGNRRRRAAVRDRKPAAGKKLSGRAHRRDRQPRRGRKTLQPRSVRAARAAAADRGSRHVLSCRPGRPVGGERRRRRARHRHRDP